MNDAWYKRISEWKKRLVRENQYIVVTAGNDPISYCPSLVDCIRDLKRIPSYSSPKVYAKLTNLMIEYRDYYKKWLNSELIVISNSHSIQRGGDLESCQKTVDAAKIRGHELVGIYYELKGLTNKLRDQP